ncbi:DUF707 domain-containing protein [Agaribacter flavus]|uniref:DUF707 domain-containing protein n=1 Tax=Agaribacter flavus TaxID=1902781 RepID=A0ABV7FKK1_9ALTE
MTVLSKSLDKSNHPYLVFTSAGNKTALTSWVLGDKNFDLFCVYYAQGNEDNLASSSDYFVKHKGAKFPNLLWVYQHWPDILNRYDYILVIDDDLTLRAEDFNRHFAMHKAEKLWLSQLAFHRRGKVNHKINEAKPFSYMRYTNFVEVNSPLFERESLLMFLKEYDAEVVGIGVDYWYSSRLADKDTERNKIAIFDIIPCCNPRDQIAKGGVREIDTAVSFDDRMKSWDIKSQKLGIERNYQKIEYRAVRPQRFIATILPSLKVLFFKVLYHTYKKLTFSQPYP